jgi:hypothetical protein
MRAGAGLARSYLKKWARNTQEPVRLTFPENEATNFWVNWYAQARCGLHLLLIFANTSVPRSLALSTDMGTLMRLVIGEKCSLYEFQKAN